MRTRESKMRWFLGFLTVGGALFAVMSCASAPRFDPEDTYIDVTNDGFPDAVVSINGQRISLVQGLSHTTIPISRWRLDVARCAYVTVHQIAGETVKTSRECLRPDEHLVLYIGSLLSTTNLIPRQ